MKFTLKLFIAFTFAALLNSSGASLALAQGSHRSPSQVQKPRTYRNIRGLVVAVVRPKRAGDKTAVTIDHEEIPRFMRAMRMTLPLKNHRDAGKLKPGMKIRFDLVLQDGNFQVANIKPLPAKTKLKLASA